MKNIKEIKEEALKELATEKENKAKKMIKTKLIELDKAKKIVKNLERELEDLEDEIIQDE